MWWWLLRLWHRNGAVYHRRRTITDVCKWRWSDSLQARALRLRWMNRRWIREPLMCRRSGELLNHISEIILVDIVNRRLIVLRWVLGLSLHRQFRRRRLRETLILSKIRIGMDRRIKPPGLLNETRLGDFVGKLIEVPEILVPACGGRTAAIISGGGISRHRRLAAFLHISYKKKKKQKQIKTQMAGPLFLL